MWKSMLCSQHRSKMSREAPTPCLNDEEITLPDRRSKPYVISVTRVGAANEVALRIRDQEPTSIAGVPADSVVQEITSSIDRRIASPSVAAGIGRQKRLASTFLVDVSPQGHISSTPAVGVGHQGGISSTSVEGVGYHGHIASTSIVGLGHQVHIHQGHIASTSVAGLGHQGHNHQGHITSTSVAGLGHQGHNHQGHIASMSVAGPSHQRHNHHGHLASTAATPYIGHQGHIASTAAPSVGHLVGSSLSNLYHKNPDPPLSRYAVSHASLSGSWHQKVVSVIPGPERESVGNGEELHGAQQACYSGTTCTQVTQSAGVVQPNVQFERISSPYTSHVPVTIGTSPGPSETVISTVSADDGARPSVYTVIKSQLDEPPCLTKETSEHPSADWNHCRSPPILDKEAHVTFPEQRITTNSQTTLSQQNRVTLIEKQSSHENISTVMAQPEYVESHVQSVNPSDQGQGCVFLTQSSESTRVPHGMFINPSSQPTTFTSPTRNMSYGMGPAVSTGIVSPATEVLERQSHSVYPTEGSSYQSNHRSTNCSSSNEVYQMTSTVKNSPSITDSCQMGGSGILAHTPHRPDMESQTAYCPMSVNQLTQQGPTVSWKKPDHIPSGVFTVDSRINKGSVLNPPRSSPTVFLPNMHTMPSDVTQVDFAPQPAHYGETLDSNNVRSTPPMSKVYENIVVSMEGVHLPENPSLTHLEESDRLVAVTAIPRSSPTWMVPQPDCMTSVHQNMGFVGDQNSPELTTLAVCSDGYHDANNPTMMQSEHASCIPAPSNPQYSHSNQESTQNVWTVPTDTVPGCAQFTECGAHESHDVHYHMLPPDATNLPCSFAETPGINPAGMNHGNSDLTITSSHVPSVSSVTASGTAMTSQIADYTDPFSPLANTTQHPNNTVYGHMAGGLHHQPLSFVTPANSESSNSSDGNGIPTVQNHEYIKAADTDSSHTDPNHETYAHVLKEHTYTPLCASGPGYTENTYKTNEPRVFCLPTSTGSNNNQDDGMSFRVGSPVHMYTTHDQAIELPPSPAREEIVYTSTPTKNDRESIFETFDDFSSPVHESGQHQCMSKGTTKLPPIGTFSMSPPPSADHILSPVSSDISFGSWRKPNKNNVNQHMQEFSSIRRDVSWHSTQSPEPSSVLQSRNRTILSKSPSIAQRRKDQRNAKRRRERKKKENVVAVGCQTPTRRSSMKEAPIPYKDSANDRLIGSQPKQKTENMKNNSPELRQVSPSLTTPPKKKCKVTTTEITNTKSRKTPPVMTTSDFRQDMNPFYPVIWGAGQEQRTPIDYNYNGQCFSPHFSNVPTLPYTGSCSPQMGRWVYCPPASPPGATITSPVSQFQPIFAPPPCFGYWTYPVDSEGKPVPMGWFTSGYPTTTISKTGPVAVPQICGPSTQEASESKAMVPVTHNLFSSSQDVANTMHDASSGDLDRPLWLGGPDARKSHVQHVVETTTRIEGSGVPLVEKSYTRKISIRAQYENSQESNTVNNVLPSQDRTRGHTARLPSAVHEETGFSTAVAALPQSPIHGEAQDICGRLSQQNQSHVVQSPSQSEMLPSSKSEAVSLLPSQSGTTTSLAPPVLGKPGSELYGQVELEGRHHIESRNGGENARLTHSDSIRTVPNESRVMPMSNVEISSPPIETIGRRGPVFSSRSHERLIPVPPLQNEDQTIPTCMRLLPDASEDSRASQVVPQVDQNMVLSLMQTKENLCTEVPESENTTTINKRQAPKLERHWSDALHETDKIIKVGDVKFRVLRISENEKSDVKTDHVSTQSQRVDESTHKISESTRLVSEQVCPQNPNTENCMEGNARADISGGYSAAGNVSYPSPCPPSKGLIGDRVDKVGIVKQDLDDDEAVGRELPDASVVSLSQFEQNVEKSETKQKLSNENGDQVVGAPFSTCKAMLDNHTGSLVSCKDETTESEHEIKLDDEIKQRPDGTMEDGICITENRASETHGLGTGAEFLKHPVLIQHLQHTREIATGALPPTDHMKSFVEPTKWRVDQITVPECIVNESGEKPFKIEVSKENVDEPSVSHSVPGMSVKPDGCESNYSATQIMKEIIAKFDESPKASETSFKPDNDESKCCGAQVEPVDQPRVIEATGLSLRPGGDEYSGEQKPNENIEGQGTVVSQKNSGTSPISNESKYNVAHISTESVDEPLVYPKVFVGEVPQENLDEAFVPLIVSGMPLKHDANESSQDAAVTSSLDMGIKPNISLDEQPMDTYGEPEAPSPSQSQTTVIKTEDDGRYILRARSPKNYTNLERIEEPEEIWQDWQYDYIMVQGELRQKRRRSTSRGGAIPVFGCSQCPAVFVAQHLKVEHEAGHSDAFAEIPTDAMSHGNDTTDSTDFEKKARPCVRRGRKSVIYRCEECNLACRYKFELVRHTRLHSTTKCYVCKVCQKNFMYKHSLTRHLALHRQIEKAEGPHVCLYCEKEFSTKMSLTHHFATHIGPVGLRAGLYRCEVHDCGNCYTSAPELIDHYNSLHPDTKPSSMTAIHSGKPCVDAKPQGQRDIPVSPPSVHKRQTEPVRKVTENTQYEVILDIRVREHRRHSDDKKHCVTTQEVYYQCVVCERHGRTKSEMIRHALVHAGKRPYICTLCHESFEEKTELRRHMGNHHGGKRPSSRTHRAVYKCCACSYTGLSISEMDRHIRVHTGERPFPCNICELSFKRQHHRTHHLTTHIGRKVLKSRVQCKIKGCNHTFRTRHELLIHAATHYPAAKGRLRSHIAHHETEAADTPARNLRPRARRRCKSALLFPTNSWFDHAGKMLQVGSEKTCADNKKDVSTRTRLRARQVSYCEISSDSDASSQDDNDHLYVNHGHNDNSTNEVKDGPAWNLRPRPQQSCSSTLLMGRFQESLPLNDNSGSASLSIRAGPSYSVVTEILNRVGQVESFDTKYPGLMGLPTALRQEEMSDSAHNLATECAFRGDVGTYDKHEQVIPAKTTPVGPIDAHEGNNEDVKLADLSMDVPCPIHDPLTADVAISPRDSNCTSVFYGYGSPIKTSPEQVGNKTASHPWDLRPRHCQVKSSETGMHTPLSPSVNCRNKSISNTVSSTTDQVTQSAHTPSTEDDLMQTKRSNPMSFEANTVKPDPILIHDESKDTIKKSVSFASESDVKPADVFASSTSPRVSQRLAEKKRSPSTFHNCGSPYCMEKETRTGDAHEQTKTKMRDVTDKNSSESLHRQSQKHIIYTDKVTHSAPNTTPRHGINWESDTKSSKLRKQSSLGKNKSVDFEIGTLNLSTIRSPTSEKYHSKHVAPCVSQLSHSLRKRKAFSLDDRKDSGGGALSSNKSNFPASHAGENEQKLMMKSPTSSGFKCGSKLMVTSPTSSGVKSGPNIMAKSPTSSAVKRGSKITRKSPSSSGMKCGSKDTVKYPASPGVKSGLKVKLKPGIFGPKITAKSPASSGVKIGTKHATKSPASYVMNSLLTKHHTPIRRSKRRIWHSVVFTTGNLDRPFGCRVCRKHFRKKGQVVAHQVIHSRARPYQCSACKRRFYLAETLRGHFIRQHARGKSTKGNMTM